MLTSVETELTRAATTFVPVADKIDRAVLVRSRKSQAPTAVVVDSTVIVVVSCFRPDLRTNVSFLNSNNYPSNFVILSKRKRCAY